MSETVTEILEIFGANSNGESYLKSKLGKTKYVYAVKDYIQYYIDRRDDAVIRALILIYDFQTSDEKAIGETRESNGVGFSGSDSEILTSFADQYKSKGWLSHKQIAMARKKIRKYWNQLYKLRTDETAWEIAFEKWLHANKPDLLA